MFSCRTQSPRNRAAFLIGLFCLPLCLLLAGCGGGTPTTLGANPTGAVVPIRETAQAGAAKTVTLRGEMIEKCPVAGCWFKLRDQTGVVRVDTKTAGFVVTEVPLHTQITVQGTTVPGSDAQIAATGIRY